MYYESIMQRELANLIQFSSEDTSVAVFNGSIYRKQLAKYGEWVNPDYPWFSEDPIMTLDEAWGEQIVENFNNNTLGSAVPVPLNHTNDVQANTGKVISVESVAGDGLYGELEILDETTIEALDKGKIFDVSISFEWNHIRTDDNKQYGSTLLHVALVNTPYLVGMSGFEKVAALSKSLNPNELSLAGQSVIMLSRNKMKELSAMGTETNLSEDVEEVTPEQPVEPTEVEETQEETAGEENVEAKEEDGEDPATELSRIRLENSELKLSKAYDELLHEGKVIPAQKEKIMGLAKISKGIELSTDNGNKIDLAAIVLDILKSGSQQFSTDETGSSKEDEAVTVIKDQEEDGRKPSEKLSEEELAGMKAVGADLKTMDELAEKDPVYAEALASLSK